MTKICSRIYVYLTLLMGFQLFIFVLILGACFAQKKSARPHIVLIIADDLGWNDVGFHGSNQIPTPNIDALAYSGLILHNYYVTPICTPSRSALMTGKYPIHTGMQHSVLFGAEPRGLSLSEKLLPQYLEDLGYVNHLVGKWHLGSYTKEYTPLYRGFRSHLGFWTGHQDCFDHSAVERPGWGLDMRRNMEVAYDLHGKFSTDVFTEESVRIINEHDVTEPLFLYLAHAAVHSGNPYNPLPAPDVTVKKFSYIKDYERQRFAAMLYSLDESVGRVTQALRSRSMLKNSIIIFTTDNGGPAAGFNLNAASNYPLRGVKNTLWEGGVRGAALLWSPLLNNTSRVAKQTMHIVDWLPTLLEVAGGNTSSLPNVDGIPMWSALSQNGISDRSEILHNIDDIYGSSALTVDSWKIVKGTNYNGTWDSWYGPSGRDYDFNITSIQTSLSGEALRSLGMLPSKKQIEEMKLEATLNCTSLVTETITCKPLDSPCLFNITADPCETQNLAKVYPEIISRMEVILQKYNQTALPPGNLPLDPRGDPKYHNYVWTNFGDSQ